MAGIDKVLFWSLKVLRPTTRQQSCSKIDSYGTPTISKPTRTQSWVIIVRETLWQGLEGRGLTTARSHPPTRQVDSHQACRVDTTQPFFFCQKVLKTLAHRRIHKFNRPIRVSYDNFESDTGPRLICNNSSDNRRDGLLAKHK